jgi:hemolysin III
MSPLSHHRIYDRKEILADAVVHGLTFVVALLTLMIILFAVWPGASALVRVVYAVYAFSLLAMIAGSGLYNTWPHTPFKWVLRRIDHAVIFLLIAGTYGPPLLLLPSGAGAVGLAGFVWGGAVLGMALKLFWPGRYDKLAIAAYLLLGWAGVSSFNELAQALPPTSLRLLVAGGLAYSLGVPFYLWHSLRFHNVVWHMFVMAGAMLHLASVYYLI